MAETDFSDVLRELDSLESELDAMRVAVDEGEETFTQAPAARGAALRHLEVAVRHVVGAAQALILEAAWDEPEDGPDAIEILVEKDVLPGRVGVTLMGLADAINDTSGDGWEADAEAEGAFERLSNGVEALAEYQEYVHHFLREWEE